MHSSASACGEVTATEGPWARSGHGIGLTVKVMPPSPVTSTSRPLVTAATPAWVAIRSSGSITLPTVTFSTVIQEPPPSDLRSRTPGGPQPPPGVHRAVSASTWPPAMARERIEPPGSASRIHWPPPSVVSHSPSPNTKPCPGVANRIPHTAGAAASPGWPTGSAGAGRPTQLRPRSRVRTTAVHGACAQGAVPSTNASSADTNVTDVAANRAGAGPPEGIAPTGVWAGVWVGVWADLDELDAERAGLLAPVPLDATGRDARLDPHPARPNSSPATATARSDTRPDDAIAHLLRLYSLRRRSQ